YDLFTFRAPDGGTELTAAFAIPRNALTQTAGGFPARLSVILYDSATGRTTRRDTVALLGAGSERNADGYLRAHLTFPVEPAQRVAHTVVVRDTANVAGSVQRGGSELRSYAGDGLRISDVVL